MKIQELERYPITIYDVKDQLKRFVYQRTNEAIDKGEKERDKIQSTEEIKLRQKFIREKFIEAIGGLPPFQTPLNPKITGTISREDFTIEKVIFESRPNVFVTCNLYLPHGITSPRGAVLFLSGHYDEAKHHPEYQTVCQYLVKAGLIVLSMDPPGQGERLDYYDDNLKDSLVQPGTGEHEYVGSQCLAAGQSIARYFVHDAMRAVDYLMTRREVDPEKIGVTGNSGGGTQTSLMMICDPRIAAAVPATFIMNRKAYLLAGQAQDAEQIWPGMTALGFDHEDILLMMAPRPVRVLAVKYDFFPIEATRQTVKHCSRFWELFNTDKGIDLIEDASVHCYTPTLAKAAAEFFSEHLLGKTALLNTDNEILPLEPSLLWCTRSGQVKIEFEQARTIYDENIEGWRKRKELTKYKGENDRLEELTWLREKVFANRRPCELNPRLNMLVDHFGELVVYNAIWWTQEGIFNHAYIFRHCDQGNEILPLTIAVWDKGTSELQSHRQKIRETCHSGRAVMVLDVSGEGALLPHPFPVGEDPRDKFNVIHKLADDLIWLNDSLAALRTYDVIRSIELVNFLPNIQNKDIHIYADGRQGIYGHWAGCLDDRITKVEVENSAWDPADWIKSRFYDPYDIMSIILR